MRNSAAMSFYFFNLIWTFKYDLKAQQIRLNHFVREYNHIRRHEALNMKTSADMHGFSTRPFLEKIPNFDYDTNYKILKVTQN